MERTKQLPPPDKAGSVRQVRTLEAMARYGGHFAKNLAAAWQHADSHNHAKLLAAFADLYEKYAEMARIEEELKIRFD